MFQTRGFKVSSLYMSLRCMPSAIFLFEADSVSWKFLFGFFSDAVVQWLCCGSHDRYVSDAPEEMPEPDESPPHMGCKQMSSQSNHVGRSKLSLVAVAHGLRLREEQLREHQVSWEPCRQQVESAILHDESTAMYHLSNCLAWGVSPEGRTTYGGGCFQMMLHRFHRLQQQ